MLQLSQQNLINLANYPGQVATNSSSSYADWSQQLIFVSDQVPFPVDASEAYLYINKALNCSGYGNAAIASSGDAGYISNCLGITSFAARAGTIMGTSAFAMNGPVEFTAKQSGRIGGVIFTILQGTSPAAIQSNYPIANAATLTQYNTLSGDGNNNTHCIWNYIAITDSISIDGNSSVVVNNLDLVQGDTYTLYSATFNFLGV